SCASPVSAPGRPLSTACARPGCAGWTTGRPISSRPELCRSFDRLTGALHPLVMASTREEPVRAPGTRAPRPRDAATLIVYRIRRGTVEVLMGQRHRRHSFLPGRYAFPGGRVDPLDSRVRAARPMRPDVEALLVRKATPGRA